MGVRGGGGGEWSNSKNGVSKKFAQLFLRQHCFKLF